MSTVLDPKINGYLIFGFKELREVALIELRNGFNKKYDLVIDFYLNRLDNSVYSRNINLKRFDRIKNIAKNYIEYEIHYSIASLNEINSTIQSQFYNHCFISEVENLVKSYQRVKLDFYEKSHSGNFCKKKHVQDLIDVYYNQCKVLEFGKLL